jgi:hypothetical protein
MVIFQQLGNNASHEQGLGKRGWGFITDVMGNDRAAPHTSPIVRENTCSAAHALSALQAEAAGLLSDAP